MARRASGFTRLPRELLIKIFNGVDNGTILACIELAPLVNEVGVETVLRRQNLPDPSTYCELEISVPENLFPGSTSYALSALLASRRNYARIKQLCCTILPPAGLHVMIHAAPMRRAARPEIFPRDPLQDRMVATFSPFTQFLTRVGQLEEVTLKLWDWTHFPDGLGALLEELVHLVVQKGCHTLQIRCAHEPSLLPWTFSRSHLSQRLGAQLSTLLSRLTCGLFGNSGTQAPRRIRPGARRLTKLNADLLFFHPTGVPWMTGLFSRCLTDLTLSFYLINSSGLYFTDRGLAALFNGAPRLQALTVLDANEDIIRSIAPGLRSFTVLKDLAIDMNGWDDFSTTPSPGTVATSFVIPRGVERLSMSPQLIDYILPGAVTALGLKEVELLYSRGDATTNKYTPSISRDVASVRRFLDGHPARISIAVRLVAIGVLHPFHHLLALTTKSAAQDQSEFSTIDALHIECDSSGALESEESRQRFIGLTTMFPNLKKVEVGCPGDFRRIPQRHPDSATGIVSKDVVQSISSKLKLKGLTQLRIGEEEYTRP